MFSRLDTAEQRTFAFKKAPVVKDLFADTLNINPIAPPFRDEYLAPALFCICKGESYMRGLKSDDETLTIAIANFMAPNTQADRLTEAESRAHFIKCVLHLFANEWNKTRLWRITPENYTAARADAAKLGLIAAAIPVEFAGMADLDPEVPGAAFTPQTAMILLMWAIKDYGSALVTRASLHMYVNCYVSFAKRGAATDEKLGKINDQMMQETGLHLGLTQARVGMIFGQLYKYIDHTNAKQIFDTWSQGMDDLSLRMKITLQQASGAGITAYTTVCTAIITFPLFDWGMVYDLIPADFGKFDTARAVIGDNMYYGFAHDLKPVAATGYRSLAYVAKELLHKYGGPDYGTIGTYAGWTKTPYGKRELDEAIKAFDPRANDEDDQVVKDRREDKREEIVEAVRASYAAEDPQE